MSRVPTYEYACRECGHRFEAVQSITADALETCPECQGSVRRVIGAVGVSFKGSGFYRTDSRAKRSTSATKPAATPAASDSKPAATDAKPAAVDTKPTKAPASES